MITINCPNCGRRNSQEFRYGGEYNPRPKRPLETADPDWADYIYMRDNKMGMQKECWYHRSGCQLWFLAERHTKSNEFEKTYLWQPPKAADSPDQPLKSPEP
jgi:heterotetrameric sarcosine oxidase delta subunit